MVESQMHTRYIGQIGGDVFVGDLDLAILHVFGMDKPDIANQAEFPQEYRTHQTIKVTSCDQPVFCTIAMIRSHWFTPLFDVQMIHWAGTLAIHSPFPQLRICRVAHSKLPGTAGSANRHQKISVIGYPGNP